MKADPIFLTLEQVLAVHAYNIRTSGGEGGVKDLGLVESAVASPQATFGGEFLHRTIPEMASAYWYGLTMNHAFVDGNKRVGLQATEIFLNMNGFELRFTEATAEAIALKIASGGMSREELVGYLKTNICLRVEESEGEEPCATPLVWEEL